MGGGGRWQACIAGDLLREMNPYGMNTSSKHLLDVRPRTAAESWVSSTVPRCYVLALIPAHDGIDASGSGSSLLVLQPTITPHFILPPN